MKIKEVWANEWRNEIYLRINVDCGSEFCFEFSSVEEAKELVKELRKVILEHKPEEIDDIYL